MPRYGAISLRMITVLPDSELEDLADTGTLKETSGIAEKIRQELLEIQRKLEQGQKPE